jgi:hypothetical protein
MTASNRPPCSARDNWTAPGLHEAIAGHERERRTVDSVSVLDFELQIAFGRALKGRTSFRLDFDDSID